MACWHQIEVLCCVDLTPFPVDLFLCKTEELESFFCGNKLFYGLLLHCEATQTA